jgi:hypothetical protein
MVRAPAGGARAGIRPSAKTTTTGSRIRIRCAAQAQARARSPESSRSQGTGADVPRDGARSRPDVRRAPVLPAPVPEDSQGPPAGLPLEPLLQGLVDADVAPMDDGDERRGHSLYGFAASQRAPRPKAPRTTATCRSAVASTPPSEAKETELRTQREGCRAEWRDRLEPRPAKSSSAGHSARVFPSSCTQIPVSASVTASCLGSLAGRIGEGLAGEGEGGRRDGSGSGVRPGCSLPPSGQGGR